MHKELSALKENKTWEIVPLLTGKKAIGCKWILKIKQRVDRSIEMYKSRLVSKGYNQKHGIDYDENFSSVVKMTTIRCIIVVAVSREWNVYQLDVNNAFLRGDLKRGSVHANILRLY